jgi:pimeloyl-ACP methyl ester carboxylesterase
MRHSLRPFRAALVLLVAVAVCRTDAGNAQPASKDFAGPIDVSGHIVYLECHGTGSPTVVLESGYHDSSQTWSLADGFPPPVLTRVAGFTRVCSYDRPGTLLYSDPPRITDRTAPVHMPRTAADVVSELHALLAAAHVPGPYILAGHSLGGLFTLLYAQTYPTDVKGLVLVDAFPATLPRLFGPQWPGYRRLLDNPLPAFATNPDFERIDIGASVAQIGKASLLRRVPLVVLTKGEPFAHPPGAVGPVLRELERWWPIAAKSLVQLEPDTPQVIANGSDHYIQIHQPDLVTLAIRLTIERARPDTSSDVGRGP